MTSWPQILEPVFKPNDPNVSWLNSVDISFSKSQPTTFGTNFCVKCNSNLTCSSIGKAQLTHKAWVSVFLKRRGGWYIPKKNTSESQANGWGDFFHLKVSSLTVDLEKNNLDLGEKKMVKRNAPSTSWFQPIDCITKTKENCSPFEWEELWISTETKSVSLRPFGIMALYSSLAQPPKTSIMRQEDPLPTPMVGTVRSPITFFRFPTNQIIFRVIVLARQMKLGFRIQTLGIHTSCLIPQRYSLSHQVQNKIRWLQFAPKKTSKNAWGA